MVTEVWAYGCLYFSDIGMPRLLASSEGMKIQNSQPGIKKKKKKDQLLVKLQNGKVLKKKQKYHALIKHSY